MRALGGVPHPRSPRHRLPPGSESFSTGTRPPPAAPARPWKSYARRSELGLALPIVVGSPVKIRLVDSFRTEILESAVSERSRADVHALQTNRMGADPPFSLGPPRPESGHDSCQHPNRVELDGRRRGTGTDMRSVRASIPNRAGNLPQSHQQIRSHPRKLREAPTLTRQVPIPERCATVHWMRPAFAHRRSVHAQPCNHVEDHVPHAMWQPGAVAGCDRKVRRKAINAQTR